MPHGLTTTGIDHNSLIPDSSSAGLRSVPVSLGRTGVLSSGFVLRGSDGVHGLSTFQGQEIGVTSSLGSTLLEVGVVESLEFFLLLFQCFDVDQSVRDGLVHAPDVVGDVFQGLAVE